MVSGTGVVGCRLNGGDAYSCHVTFNQAIEELYSIIAMYKMKVYVCSEHLVCMAYTLLCWIHSYYCVSVCTRRCMYMFALMHVQLHTFP